MRLHRLFGWALALPVCCLALQNLPAQETHARLVSPDVRNLEQRNHDPLTRTGVRHSVVVSAIERVRAAVVNIHSERIVGTDHYNAASGSNRVNGMGTGIIVDPRGYIVTNHHVVDDVNLLRIRLADGTTYQATIVARNAEQDLALIKIDPKEPLPTMPVGTASDLMVGETVIAIGNAFGYEHTVSVGVVSAIKRDVSLNKDMSYKSLIQTDASINPGNSGGPLINVNGELVGVNVAIRAGAQGIGFAIPADHMVRSVAEMLRGKRRSQNYDGMVVRDRVEPGEEATRRSVSVDYVEADSPAARAGLRSGDVIVQLGEVPIVCSYDVERALLERRANESVPVKVLRQTESQTADLVLASPDRQIRPVAGTDLVWQRLGLLLAPVPADQVHNVNKQLNGGLEVTDVQNESTASRAGIRKGDILVGLHQWETLTIDNVTYVLSHPDVATFQPLSFFILRSGQVRRGYLNAQQ